MDHLFQTNAFKSNLKKTFISKYGVDNPWKDTKVKDKIKRTNLEKFGEASWLKVEENKKKISELITKINSESRMAKIDKFNIPISIEDFNTNEVKIKCKSCQNSTSTSTSYFNKKISAGQNPCLKCSPPLYSESKSENELGDYLKEIYLGFNFLSKSKPNYFWCKNNIRYHRFNFRKDKLIKEGFDKNKTEDVIMTERGYYKLWDFGNLKWEYKKKA